MWDDIDFAQETTQELKWVAEGMQNNTLVWTTDGSYDKKGEPICLAWAGLYSAK
jgi:hypothetical protein